MTNAAKRRIAEEVARIEAEGLVGVSAPARTRTYSSSEINAFSAQHPEKLAGQLWERCRCGAEPVYMPSHCCPQCIMRGSDHPRLSGSAAPIDTTEPTDFIQ